MVVQSPDVSKLQVAQGGKPLRPIGSGIDSQIYALAKNLTGSFQRIDGRLAARLNPLRGKAEVC